VTFASSGVLDSAETRAAAAPVVDTPVADHRIASLDFSKGVLVLLMVVYHWLNYFIGLQWEGYKYLRFLTPAFVFISGFVVSRVYLERYSFDDPRLRRRLIRRGLKLLALFLSLNVLIDWTLGGGQIVNFSDPSAALSWGTAIFIKGRGRAAFEILVPIAYFLLLAPFVLLLSRRLRVSLSAIAVMAIVAASALSSVHRLNPHVEVLSIAFAGLAVGSLSTSRTASVLSWPVLLLPAYLIYLGAVTIWNVPYPLLVVGVALNLLLIAVIGTAWGTSGAIQQYVVRMGQYSLLSYIAQIAALQVLRRALSGRHLDWGALAGAFVAALAVTIVVVELSVLLRSRSLAFDRLYRTIFA
jgi:peptidoglycan/LPS O-acetylase OafA/YrhL